MSLLEIKNLTTSFATEQGKVQAVRGISLSVEQGEIVGIVGESGSGKSQSMYSVMGLLSENGTIESGSILFDGQEISPVQFDGNAAAYEKLMEGIRGNSMSMIFQDPMSFLNPYSPLKSSWWNRSRTTRRCPRRSCTRRQWNCSPRWASPPRRNASSSIRISCPAVCASV